MSILRYPLFWCETIRVAGSRRAGTIGIQARPASMHALFSQGAVALAETARLAASRVLAAPVRFRCRPRQYGAGMAVGRVGPRLPNAVCRIADVAIQSGIFWRRREWLSLKLANPHTHIAHPPIHPPTHPPTCLGGVLRRSRYSPVYMRLQVF